MLQGKAAIITGGSRGIGRAIAHKFASLGAALVLGALHDDRLFQTRDEIAETGCEVEVCPGDIAEPEKCVEFHWRIAEVEPHAPDVTKRTRRDAGTAHGAIGRHHRQSVAHPMVWPSRSASVRNTRSWYGA